MMVLMAGTVRERSSPQRIAERAAKIYDDVDVQVKNEHAGQFMVVDVTSGEYYISEFSEEALRLAREAAPHGVFHLIRIGAPSAFKVSFSAGHDANWSWPL